MKSIRIFLLIALLSTITLVNFVAALHGYRASMAEAERLFDRQILGTARLLAAMPVNRAASLVVNENDLQAFQVWSRDGKILMRSDNAPVTPIGEGKAGFSEENFSGFRWRVYRHTGDDGRSIRVAERVDLRFRLADEVVLQSVVPILLGLPVAGLLIWLVVGRGLNSLRQLADELRRKRAEDLTPLALSSPPEELLPLVRSTNALLERLQASFDRERRFSADAAHELRTPIAAIQVHADNLANLLAKNSGETQQSLLQLQNSIARMSHLVEQMLNLFRMTPEHYPARFEPIDLHRLARDVIADSYPTFARRAQEIELGGEAAYILGDQFALVLLLQNLLNNAGKYTPESGRIAVDVRVLENAVVLQVADSGPGISTAERERVFERFYRVGGDRHESRVSGCGLGLSIVHHIAELHQAQITLGPSPLGRAQAPGLLVVVRFPSLERTTREITNENVEDERALS
ncbi:ATP-binding protein [Microbulbifer bruguierae]|uniref:histidine kinase n=1 Tax=Microbulbifer bruguierae TaxID=3029061 RepID=A0ABY8NHL7_9GAMM|nr:ATP-binding protein [Microbulbifer bruguierae]WGL18421.1 ATP-binding protein [Microbulbifer bruguierae]